MKYTIEGKNVTYSTKARQGVLDGINIIANAIKVTLGPRGKTVLIEKELGYPHLTKDGVTVARSIRLNDSLKNMGVEMIRNVAAQTCDRAGDGTTTASVLAQSIANEAFMLCEGGANPVNLKKGVEAAKDFVVSEIRAHAQEVNGQEDLRRVAYIASNGDNAISDILAQAFDKVGRDGVVTIEEGTTTALELEFVEGMRFDSGYLTPLVVNNIDRMTCEYKDCWVMVHEKPILNLHPYISLLGEVKRTDKPILLIAENVEAGALSTIGVNATERNLFCCPVKTPGNEKQRKVFNHDIAAFVGGTMINQDLGKTPEKLDIKLLGMADKVIVTQDKTIIMGGLGKKDPKKNKVVEGIVNSIRDNLNDDNFEGDKEFLKMRLGMLTQGIACVKVGGASMLELRERKDRVEDAYFATKAAYKGGVVPGGGIALLRASLSLSEMLKDDTQDHDYLLGVKIIQRACQAPFGQIIRNTGVDGVGLLMEAVLQRDDYRFGYDANKEEIIDMVERGIIDPADVVVSALEDAVSAGSALISLEAAVLYDENKSKERDINTWRP